MNVASGFGENLSGGSLVPPDILSAGESLSAVTFPSQPGFIESTILRIRGSLSVPKSTYNPLAAQTSIFAFGIGIISDRSALLTDAIPNPATASGYDWDGWDVFAPGWYRCA